MWLVHSRNKVLIFWAELSEAGLVLNNVKTPIYLIRFDSIGIIDNPALTNSALVDFVFDGAEQKLCSFSYLKLTDVVNITLI